MLKPKPDAGMTSTVVDAPNDPGEKPAAQNSVHDHRVQTAMQAKPLVAVGVFEDPNVDVGTLPLRKPCRQRAATLNERER